MTKRKVKTGKGTRKNSLAIVRKFFPKVNDIVDATKPLHVHVTAQDVKTSARKEHSDCAMAVACKREVKADGVIMAISTAYVIRGNQATRYQVPPSVGREVVSFDRGSAFAPGEYQLSAIQPTRRLGVSKGDHLEGKSRRDGSRSRHLHMTDGIRATLGAR